VKKLGITMLVVPLVLLAAACGGGDDGPPPKPVYPDFIDISADLTLSGANYVRGNLSECAGAGAYADVVKGAPVLVSNKVGKPLVVGAIAYGVGTNVYRNRLDQCTFRLRVPHTPRAMTYQLTIGRQKPIAVSFLGLVRSRGTASFALPPRTAATTTTTPLPAFAPEPAG
jgi:hypothetical protein